MQVSACIMFLPRSFANDRWEYQEGFTVYFPRTLLCNPTSLHKWVGYESRRHATRQEAMGCQFRQHSPYTSHHKLLACSRCYAGKGRTPPYVSQAPRCLQAPKPCR
jgi:hypothetical protein